MHQLLDMLVDKRQECGVPKANFYLFAIPGASCTKTRVDFLLKHGVRSNQNALQHTKISGCINVCARMNPSTFRLYIPINVELSAHVGVPDSSLSTPLLKYANHI